MLSEPSPEGLLTGSWLDASFPVPRWQMALHLQGFAYEQSSRRAQAEEISNRRQRHQPNPRPFSDRSPNIPSTAAPVRYPYLRYKKKSLTWNCPPSLSELGAASPDADAPDPADTLRPSRCASHCRSRSRYRCRYLPYGVSVGRNHHTRATSTTHDPRPTAWPTQQAR
ncbi:uncharacterized protein QC761_0026640 [Podospora bellae-mahoneyi]|uniref:Uncharacterized protein n=1 Tax=Podospora bellae-mahoneyi TaxID=2093777 RepID=A0ABR0FT86_9PEZI|nr:hypothetical protein QC761_0026640 [Podospora bellae-mahoneyi]